MFRALIVTDVFSRFLCRVSFHVRCLREVYYIDGMWKCMQNLGRKPERKRPLERPKRRCDSKMNRKECSVSISMQSPNWGRGPVACRFGNSNDASRLIKGSRVYFLQLKGRPIISPCFVLPNIWQQRPESVCPKCNTKSKSDYDRLSVGQSVLLSGAHLGPVTNCLKLSLDSCGVVDVRRPLWQEIWFVLPAQSLSATSLARLMNKYHCIIFGIPPPPHNWRPRVLSLFPQEQGSPIISPALGLSDSFTEYYVIYL
jgi:hypothetical protein